MRRFVRPVFLPLILLIVSPLLFLQGCARPVLQTYPVAEPESRETLAAFAKHQQLYLDQCGCCLDAEAEATVSMSIWFSNHSGKFSGYLQAMEPGYIKFFVLNPFGQPVYILATDGTMFKSLNVLESKAYLANKHHLKKCNLNHD